MSIASRFSSIVGLYQDKHPQGKQILRVSGVYFILMLTCFSFILLTACQPVKTQEAEQTASETNKQATKQDATKQTNSEANTSVASTEPKTDSKATENTAEITNSEATKPEKTGSESKQGAGQLDAALLAENSDSEALGKAEDLAVNLDELDAELSALTGPSDSSNMPNASDSGQISGSPSDSRSDSPDVPAADPDQALQGAQITKVAYQDANKQTIKTTFRTSAEGKLTADVVLANGRKLTLHAPEGQGNNPTYRSSDGSVELVSHSGGSSIDLLIDGKASQYSAVSAEAEVVTEM